jgi:RNA polymerase sigma factor for flagellar operon FliA
MDVLFVPNWTPHCVYSRRPSKRTKIELVFAKFAGSKYHARRTSLDSGQDHAVHDTEFIQQYDAFVRGIVKHTRAQLGIEGDHEDLLACGYEGLVEARQRFDPARGVQFKSFAYYRVRGAVLDGVRRMAYLPRRAYARLKAAETLDLEGDAATQARASGADKVAEGETAMRALDGILGRVAAAYCTAASVSDEEQHERSPEQRVIARQQNERVRAAIETLPQQEQFLIRGHYIDGRNFDELASELGLSKSWASRLHSRALDRMRVALEAE